MEAMLQTQEYQNDVHDPTGMGGGRSRRILQRNG